MGKMKHLNYLKNISCCYFFGSATMKNGDQTCLNPDSPDVKKLIKEWEKQVGEKRKTFFFLLEINLRIYFSFVLSCSCFVPKMMSSVVV